MKSKTATAAAISFGVLVALNGLPQRGFAKSDNNAAKNIRAHHSCGITDVKTGNASPLFHRSMLGTGNLVVSNCCNCVCGAEKPGECGGKKLVKDCLLTSVGCKTAGC